MPIDLSTIPEALRTKLIKLGEQYGSQDTLDQANQTLGAYAKHAKALPGFSSKDAKRLEEARDALLEAGVGRDAVKGTKKATGKAYVEAVRKAQAARLSARALLASAHEDLEESSAPEAREAERKASAALALTRVGPTKAEPLAQQLAQLAAALKDPAVAAAAEGADEAVGALEAATQALRQADQTDVARRGTPVETETLDLLDGLIVRLTRRARRAAGAAARLGGNPALAQAFQLDKLYRSKGGAPPRDDDEGEGGDDGGAELRGAGRGSAAGAGSPAAQSRASVHAGPGSHRARRCPQRRPGPARSDAPGRLRSLIGVRRRHVPLQPRDQRLAQEGKDVPLRLRVFVAQVHREDNVSVGPFVDLHLLCEGVVRVALERRPGLVKHTLDDGRRVLMIRGHDPQEAGEGGYQVTPVDVEPDLVLDVVVKCEVALAPREGTTVEDVRHRLFGQKRVFDRLAGRRTKPDVTASLCGSTWRRTSRTPPSAACPSVALCVVPGRWCRTTSA
ncbi:MAG TPA: hypothetical protein VFS43_26080 [Polyangiaceae bacterium]|nr:hypothetical protein [Polyangiaceae bacterium]